MVIVKIYAPIQLGFFNRSKSFVSISSNNITQIVQRVSTPILCETQNDKERMGYVLIRFIQKTAFITYPLLIVLFVLSDPLIKVLLTEKWLPVSWMLQVLCPVGMLFVISTFNMNIFNATGRTGLAFKSEVIKKILNLLILFGAILISFEALIFSQIIVSLIDLFVDTYFTRRQIGLGLLKQLKSISGIVIASIFMGIIIKLIVMQITNDNFKLFYGILSGLIFYFIICLKFNIAGFNIFFKQILNNFKK